MFDYIDISMSNRTERIALRVSPDEKTFLSTKAGDEKKSLSDYVRDIILPEEEENKKEASA